MREAIPGAGAIESGDGVRRRLVLERSAHFEDESEDEDEDDFRTPSPFLIIPRPAFFGTTLNHTLAPM